MKHTPSIVIPSYTITSAIEYIQRHCPSNMYVHLIIQFNNYLKPYLSGFFTFLRLGYVFGGVCCSATEDVCSLDCAADGCSIEELCMALSASKFKWFSDGSLPSIVFSSVLSCIVIDGASCGTFLGVDVSTLLVGGMSGDVDISEFILGVDGILAMTVGVLYLFRCI